MAFSTNGGSGLGRSRFRGSTTTLAEINIIPLVDVVLVLLIIFMLTAHVMEFGLEVDVPKVKASSDAAKELPVINITKDGESYLNDKPVNINQLSEAVTRRFGTTKSVYLRADKEARFDVVAQVIAALGEAKLGVNIVTQPLEDNSRKR